ncbi:MAG: rod shape-determining protein [Thermacetogeniaceae bacterium]|jgi:rod shape-determining protein MreB|nr:rod shape-determining protein MreB [Thermoanaerobacterales bacterium]NLN21577.1 rod shape-determining protein MreB [Syntrophomonadaceae bacterium]
MFWKEDIGVDLGTATVLVYLKSAGIVLNEPTVVAIDTRKGEMIAVGDEARQMLGRTPGNIVAVRPLREGVIADYNVTEYILRYFIRKAVRQRFLIRPRVMVCIPSGATSIEQRAAKQAIIQAGAGQAYLIEEPVAAALGAGIRIEEARGNMVVDVGGGTTDVAVLSLGGVVCTESIRVAGNDFDEAIIRHVRKVYNLMIGECTAEELKIGIGTAYPEAKDPGISMQIRGRDLVTGLPKTIEVTTGEVAVALQEPVSQIVNTVKEVLEQTPPELAADIVDRGIVMTGGGALLHGLDMLISEETGLAVHVAEDAISCVAKGTGMALDMLHVLQRQGGRP